MTVMTLSNSRQNYLETRVLNFFLMTKLIYLAYGKNSEDVTKHLNRSIVTDEDILAEKCQSRYFKQSQQIMNEENIVAGHLLSERKTKIDDDKPCQIGFSILAWSKLLFLRYD